MKKKKPSALQAWKMLLLSLPKGIAAFVTVVAGLSVSLPLSVFLVGIPLLAETLVLCGSMLEAERRKTTAWSEAGDLRGAETTAPRVWGGWRSLLAVLGRGRSYRGILYGLFQLPVGIAGFTLGIVLPVTAWAVMLSPLAYLISTRLFSFELFSDPIVWDRLVPTWSGIERSWLAAGIGAVFVLLMPVVLRSLGRLYASWISAAAGPVPAPAIEEVHSGPAGEPFASEKLPEPPLYA